MTKYAIQLELVIQSLAAIVNAFVYQRTVLQMLANMGTKIINCQDLTWSLTESTDTQQVHYRARSIPECFVLLYSGRMVRLDG